MVMTRPWNLRFGAGLALVLCGALAARAEEAAKKGADPNAPVSYDKQVRLIFQAHCQGCHQPSKAGGGYVMTAFDRLLAGGDSKETAVVAMKPDDSHLLEMITPDGGKA